jgi:hypothetical protein
MADQATWHQFTLEAARSLAGKTIELKKVGARRGGIYEVRGMRGCLCEVVNGIGRRIGISPNDVGRIKRVYRVVEGGLTCG